MEQLMYKEHPHLDGVIVCSNGSVYVGYPKRWSRGTRQPSGYMRVTIKKKSYFIHRLVAETFLGECPEGFEVDHINRLRDDNQLSNIRYVTRSENRRNRKDYEELHTKLGFSEPVDESTYRAYYARSEKGRQARQKANLKYWSLNKEVWFSDGKRHVVPIDMAKQLLTVPVNQRHWENNYGRQ